jgi:hypothetical protein
VIVRVDGKVPIAERAKRIAAFEQRSNYDVMLLTSQVRVRAIGGDVSIDVCAQVGGVGLNLTAASRVVILDPSWTNIDNQAVRDCVGVRACSYGVRIRIGGSCVSTGTNEECHHLPIDYSWHGRGEGECERACGSSLRCDTRARAHSDVPSSDLQAELAEDDDREGESNSVLWRRRARSYVRCGVMWCATCL